MTTLILAASCRKEIVENNSPNKPNANNHTELLWKALLDSSKNGPLTIDPVIFENDVIVSSSDFEPKNVINKFSGATGEKLASWGNWSRTPSILLGSGYTILNDNSLIIEGGADCVALNLETFQTNWQDVKVNQIVNSKRIIQHKEHVYSTARFDFSMPAGFNKKCSIIRYELNQLKIDTILTLTALADFSPWVEGLAFGSLSNGDEVIFGKNRLHRDYFIDPNNHVRLGVFAFNITRNQMLWNIDSVEVGVSGGVVKSLFHNGLAIIFGQTKIHAFELETGVKKWTFDLGNNAFGGTPFLHKGRLLYKDVWNSLFAIDPNTGKQLWRLDDMGGCEEQVVLFNDKLFYCFGDLWVVSADNGTVLYSSKGADWDMGAPLLNTPAIDPVNRRIYLSDGHILFAIKMLDSW
jgi:outer membrane protein assembly factor BamB